MKALKQFSGKLSAFPHLDRFFRGRRKRRFLENSDIDEVFTRIFKKKSWGGSRSASGAGSDPEQTQTLIRELPRLFDELEIQSILDVPCGDFEWMRHLNLKTMRYTGGDIVEEMIQHNREAYGKESVRFQCLNLVRDKLPEADLILCRDGLVHLSFDDVFKALQNICSTKATYLLATTFTDRIENEDILSGQWRTLNLERPPFSLTEPLKILNEKCPHQNGIYADKSLGLWKIETVRAHLAG
jgi:SAM-dependent methyltransferase